MSNEMAETPSRKIKLVRQSFVDKSQVQTECRDSVKSHSTHSCDNVTSLASNANADSEVSNRSCSLESGATTPKSEGGIVNALFHRYLSTSLIPGVSGNGEKLNEILMEEIAKGEDKEKKKEKSHKSHKKHKKHKHKDKGKTKDASPSSNESKSKKKKKKKNKSKDKEDEDKKVTHENKQSVETRRVVVKDDKSHLQKKDDKDCAAGGEVRSSEWRGKRKSLDGADVSNSKRKKSDKGGVEDHHAEKQRHHSHKKVSGGLGSIELEEGDEEDGYQQELRDENRRRHEKLIQKDRRRVEDVPQATDAEKNCRLRADIVDLREKLKRLKSAREDDIDRKRLEHRKRMRDRKRSPREKRHSSQEKKSHREKRRSVSLKITAPLEVAMYDQSITPPHSSPEYDYSNEYYRHPDDVKPIFGEGDIEPPTRGEPVRHRSPGKFDEHHVPYRDTASRERDSWRQEERLFYDRRSGSHVDPGDRRRDKEYTEEPGFMRYEGYDGRKHCDYQREETPSWMKREGVDDEHAKRMMQEAEEALRMSQEAEGVQGRKFVSIGEKVAKDQVVYDVLVREGPDGLEKLDDEEKEDEKTVIHEDEKAEESAPTPVKKTSETATVEETPNLLDDIETKEREMIREMRERMERRMRAREERERKEEEARREQEQQEREMQAMQEERQRLEVELQRILAMSDEDYVHQYGMKGALRRKPGFEDVEPGEVTTDSDAYEVVEGSDSEDDQKKAADIPPMEMHNGSPAMENASETAEDVNAVENPPEEKKENEESNEVVEPLPPGVSETEVMSTLPVPVVPPPKVSSHPTSDGETAGGDKPEDKKSAKKIGIKISQMSASLISAAPKAEEGKGTEPTAIKEKPKEDGELSESSWSDDNDEKEEVKTKDGEPKTISSSSDELPESSGSISDSDDGERSKKKKKKKEKKKKKKEKRSKQSSRERSREKHSRRDDSSHRSRLPDRHRHESRSKSRSRSRDRDRHKKRDIWSTRGGSRDKYRHRSRSRERHHAIHGRHDRDRHEYASHSHRRSRDRKDSDDLRVKIDKAKLREIAIRNATNNAKSGLGPTLDLPPDEMATLRAGGKSLTDLTAYCKKIAERQAQRNAQGEDSDSDVNVPAGSDEDDGAPFIQHPFKVKEAPIIMNIRNSRQLPVLNPHEKAERSKALRLEFPVSSGSQHRRKEDEWIPVEKPTTAEVLATKPAAPPPKKLFPAHATPPVTAPMGGVQPLPPGEPIPPPPPPPPAPPVLTTGVPGPGVVTVKGVAKDIARARAEQEKAEKAADAAAKKAEIAAMVAAAKEKEAEAAVPAEAKVFSEPSNKDLNIGAIVSARLSALRKLQENPMDVEAINSMYHAQQQMNEWAESKQLPGQFLGSTGAQVLSQQELLGDPKRQAWTRKDVFTSAAPVSGGVGKFLLQKMGWKEGEGLGKEGTGNLEPLMLDVKTDRKGLNAEGEGSKRLNAVVAAAGAGPTAGKHPVSALMELCKKRHWSTPAFDQVAESGPAHRKKFLFKVRVNNVDYQPNVASNNKKLAKMNAAIVCLQALGIPCQAI